MGVVYKAQDIRLHRFVALKFISSAFASDRDSVERFRREAEAASALNHPNICTIYDIGEQQGLAFIAMEFLDGRMLKDCIASKPMPLEQVLDLSIQITDGLEAAHQSGIVHRDVKPANVFVTKQGRVKILDFGLAKLSRQSMDGTTLMGDESLGTIAATLTQPGTMMGTVAYMSPEQVRGEPLDARTDIFSFGLVLYEMATGQQAFQGNTTGVVTEAILNRTPSPLRRLVPYDGLPLERIVTKALQKGRNQRYQSAAEMRTDLLEYKSNLAAGRPARISIKERLSAPPPKWSLRIGAGTVVVALVVGSWLLYPRHAHALKPSDTIVLADFSNTTGDPIFDGTLKQALAMELEQSPFINVIADPKVASTLKSMSRATNERLTQAVAAEVCLRTKSKAIIVGSIAQVGDHYLLGLKALNCETQNAVATTMAQAKDRNGVLNALEHASTEMREKVGESLASIQKYDVAIENVTTSSLEALQAYSKGYLAMNVNEDWQGAIPFFERAADLDPNFAMAYARLAVNYGNSGDMAQARENVSKAYELRQRVSEREKFYIESTYARSVTENLEAARKIYEEWQRTYPQDDVPPNDLGVIYSLLGDREKALAAYQESLRLDPGSGISYANLAGTYLALNRLDESKAKIQEAQAHGLDSPNLHLGLYHIAFLQGDAAGMERESATLLKRSGWEPGVMLYIESETAARSGQMLRARELAQRAVEELQRAGFQVYVGNYEIQAALREALVGNPDVAKREVGDALKLTENPYARALTAVVLGLTGDSARATQMADDLARRFPEATSMQFHYLPMIRGAVAMKSGRGDKAVAALAVGEPFELGSPTILNFIRLYPIYMHGLACLAARQGPPAAAEFQKILDHPGMVVNEPIGALAHLGLGRAYAMTGDTSKAKTAYQDFLALWKNADPDVPILKEAKLEYAKLQ